MQLRNLESTSQEDSDFQPSSIGHSFRFQKSVEVYVQSFRGLPVRIRVQNEWGQVSQTLPERFQDAVDYVISHSNISFDQQNCWFLYGYRHGSLDEVAELVSREISSTIDEEALAKWQQTAILCDPTQPTNPTCSVALVRAYLRNNPTWGNQQREARKQPVQRNEALYRSVEFAPKAKADTATSDSHDTLPAVYQAFKITARRAEETDQWTQELEGASGLVSMIKAMNAPSHNLRQQAFQYFSHKTHTDRFNPRNK